MTRTVYAIATMDTKGPEIRFVAERLRASGLRALTVDVGTREAPTGAPDVTRETVAACHPDGAGAVLGLRERGAAVAAMAVALERWLRQRHAEQGVAGAIGLGGTGGTALIAPALRALPVGVPKLLVSTVASGSTAAYIGESDLILVPSITDIAGLNRVSRVILGNAAQALAGMASAPAAGIASGAGDRPVAAMTMFGVTTPCVTAVRAQLERDGWDCLVFHATGTGGRAMESLARAGLVQALADLTTTEVADEVVGGVFACGPGRFSGMVERTLPCVMSLGALDMVNFGARDTVPERFRSRRLHTHNAQVTLMRTTPEENRACARWIAERVNRSTAPLTILVPERGVSALDAPGQPFHDPEADAALFDELERCIDQTPTRRFVRLPLHINDPAFAAAALAELARIAPRAVAAGGR